MHSAWCVLSLRDGVVWLECICVAGYVLGRGSGVVWLEYIYVSEYVLSQENKVVWLECVYVPEGTACPQTYYWIVVLL